MNSSYDVADYVEAPKDVSSLEFKDEKQQARFELGVSMMVYKWDALDIAVANSWGGPDSAEKRDWITGVIVDLFKTGKIVDVGLIEETLLYAMVDEFDTNVEDDSALPIAAGIVRLYRECDALNYSNVERLYVEWQEKQARKTDARIVEVKEDPMNPDVSDSEDDEQEEVPMLAEDVEMDIDEPNKPETIIDEDGFELVTKKGRRR
ncbi:LAFE_0A02410g1_1 [Lachancea fermentati]|uniref:LAFE_0A02410g1_1 n=1 Tax=Lachancea fermentati TaxID=4955 RepID=A0A1G4M6K3_LACFM|nr:LAFE_0A02410g1_1 [Lachancea fermentati]